MVIIISVQLNENSSTLCDDFSHRFVPTKYAWRRSFQRVNITTTYRRVSHQRSWLTQLHSSYYYTRHIIIYSRKRVIFMHYRTRTYKAQWVFIRIYYTRAYRHRPILLPDTRGRCYRVRWPLIAVARICVYTTIRRLIRRYNTHASCTSPCTLYTGWFFHAKLVSFSRIHHMIRYCWKYSQFFFPTEV